MKTGIKDEIDLHGRRVAEAEEVFFEVLNEVRMKGKPREVVFITGPGKIQERFKGLAKEHDLNAYIPLANRGCLIVEFE